MRALALLVTFPVVVSPLASPPTPEGVLVAWKLAKGAELRYRCTSREEKTYSGLGEIEDTSQLDRVLVQKVRELGEDGTATLDCRWTALRMHDRVVAPGFGTVELVYDSTDRESTPPPPMKGIEKLVGVEFQMQRKASGEIVVFDGLAEAKQHFLEASAAPNERTEKALSSCLDEDPLRNILEDVIWPEHALKGGDTWGREISKSMESMGSARGRFAYAWQGVVEEQGLRCGKVDVEYTISTELAPQLQSELSSGTTEMETHMGDAKGHGTIYFALDKGCIVSSTFRSEVSFTVKSTPKKELLDGAIEVKARRVMLTETKLLGDDEPAFEKRPKPK